MSRPLRTLSILAPHTVSPRPLLRFRHSIFRPNGDVKVQRVRFRSGGSASSAFVRRAFQVLISSVFLYEVGKKFILDDEENETATDQAEAEGEENNEFVLPEETPEDAIFIPLWFGTKLDRYRYSGHDPEWQSYLPYSGDHQKQHEIKHHTAERAKDHLLESMPKYEEKVLGSPVNVRQFLLTIIWPRTAPTEYSIPGIEIADDYVAVINRTMSEAEYKSFESILWPTSMAKSFWQGFKFLWEFEKAKMADSLNIKQDPNAETRPLRRYAQDVHRLSKNGKEQLNRRLDAGYDKMSEPNATETADTTKIGAKAARNTSDAASVVWTVLDKITAAMVRFTPSLLRPDSIEMGAAAHVLMLDQQLSSHNHNYDAPRGSVKVLGTVELVGTKGVTVLDISAHYDLETSEVDLQHVTERIRTPKVIAPLRRA